MEFLKREFYFETGSNRITKNNHINDLPSVFRDNRTGQNIDNDVQRESESIYDVMEALIIFDMGKRFW